MLISISASAKTVPLIATVVEKNSFSEVTLWTIDGAPVALCLDSSSEAMSYLTEWFLSPRGFVAPLSVQEMFSVTRDDGAVLF